ncbi:MAG TPA: 50S ribosomal protein L9 [Rhodothermales bacterium]
MKLILKEDVEKLGEAGDVVTVKDGFGRNYLIPRGLARIATPGSIKAHEEEKRQQSRRLARKKEEALEVARQLEATEIPIQVKVGEENRIFGTVTSQQIATELTGRGFEVDRRKIELSEDIRVIGVYTASVKLHPEVTAQVKIRVIPESQGEV